MAGASRGMNEPSATGPAGKPGSSGLKGRPYACRGGAARTAALLLALLSASCAIIGPTVHVEAGPGKSQAAFEADRTGCGRLTDRQLQPVADRLNGPGVSSQQVAANNRQIQASYDATFADCMASHGHILGADAAAAAATVAVVPAPSREPTVPEVLPRYLHPDWQFLALRYHTKAERTPDAEAALWRSEIDDPPDGQGDTLPTYSVTFPDGPRSIVVSIAQLGAATCDNGPNSATSTRDYAICPAKVGVVEGGRLVMSRDVGKLCAETINDGGVRRGAAGLEGPGTMGHAGPIRRTSTHHRIAHPAG